MTFKDLKPGNKVKLSTKQLKGFNYDDAHLEFLGKTQIIRNIHIADNLQRLNYFHIEGFLFCFYAEQIEKILSNKIINKLK